MKRRDVLLLPAALSMARVLAPAPTARAAPSAAGDPRLMQGPMIGDVGPTHVQIWGRASGQWPVSVEYGTRPDLADAVRTPAVTAQRAEDFIVRVRLEGLTPATTYHYRFRFGEQLDPYQGSLPPFPVRTAPAPGAATPLRIAFGSCARIQTFPEQPIWTAVQARAPDLFLWLGDNVYIDSLEPAIMAEEYRRQRELPNIRPLLRSVPQLAIWDDHDSALNDHDRTNPVKDEALAAFRRYWANPSYGLPDAPGVFFHASWGAVDLFMLDGRYHRDPNAAPDAPSKTMLGQGQMTWLRQRLEASRATFKILCCGSGWSKAKGPGGDAWSAFLAERDALFDFIRDRRIEGVVLLSGDTHVGEMNVIPWSERGGYDLYEVVSSPLAQDVAYGWLEQRPEARVRQVFSGCNFGLLEFQPPDRLTCRLVNDRGQDAMAPLTLGAGDLRVGRRSWPEKIDAVSLRRREAERQGRNYDESR